MPEAKTYKRHLPHIEVEGSYYFTTSTTKDRQSLSPAERSLTLSAILFHNSSKYELEVAVVMPDHFHLILQPLQGFSLSEIFHSIKGYSAKQIVAQRSTRPHPLSGGDARPTRARQLISRFSNPLTGLSKQRGGATIWQDENFDHLIRDEKDYLEKFNYIVNNPTTAKLVQAPEDYPWLLMRSQTESEFLSRREMAEDHQDLLDLEQARHENAGDPGVPYETFRKERGLD